MTEEQRHQIQSVFELLIKDPNAPKYHQEYGNTVNLLTEVTEKDGSLLSGLLASMETYLNK